MNEVTRILDAIEQGDARAAGQLLPLVYDELRKLAAQRWHRRSRARRSRPTALVHEAYLRLVGQRDGPALGQPRHFFAAAAEAMRRSCRQAAAQTERQTWRRPGSSGGGPG